MTLVYNEVCTSLRREVVIGFDRTYIDSLPVHRTQPTFLPAVCYYLAQQHLMVTSRRC